MRDEFKVHRLSEEGLAEAADLAEAFSDCLSRVERVIAGAVSRVHEVELSYAELSLKGDLDIVRVKLQEASFFAKRALAQRIGEKP